MTPVASGPPAGGGRLAVRLLAAAAVSGVAGLLLLASGPLLFRLGILDFRSAAYGLSAPALAALIACAALSLAAGLAAMSARSSRAGILAVLFLTAALIPALRIFAYRAQTDALPVLHDVQTRWDDPVAFSGQVLASRTDAGAAPLMSGGIQLPASAVSPAGTPGAVQAAVFDLAPLTIEAGTAAVEAAVSATAARVGWNIMSRREEGGRIYFEGETRSFWYGIASDISVRLTPSSAGITVDVRSASRTAVSDLGASAARIRIFLDDLAFLLSQQG
jgi:uncharacterized protein (DUF1499 family)